MIHPAMAIPYIVPPVRLRVSDIARDRSVNAYDSVRRDPHVIRASAFPTLAQILSRASATIARDPMTTR